LLISKDSRLRRRLAPRLQYAPENRSWSVCQVQKQAEQPKHKDSQKNLIPSMGELLPSLAFDSAAIEDLVPVLSQSTEPTSLVVAITAIGVVVANAWAKSHPPQTEMLKADASVWADEVLPEIALDAAALEDIIPVLVNTSVYSPFGSALWTVVIALLATSGDIVGLAKKTTRRSPENKPPSTLPSASSVLGSIESQLLPIESTIEDLAPVAVSGSPAAPIVTAALLMALAGSALTLSQEEKDQPSSQLPYATGSSGLLARLMGMLNIAAVEALTDDLLPILFSEEMTVPGMPALFAFVFAVIAGAGSALFQKNQTKIQEKSS